MPLLTQPDTLTLQRLGQQVHIMKNTVLNEALQWAAKQGLIPAHEHTDGRNHLNGMWLVCLAREPARTGDRHADACEGVLLCLAWVGNKVTTIRVPVTPEAFSDPVMWYLLDEHNRLINTLEKDALPPGPLGLVSRYGDGCIWVEPHRFPQLLEDIGEHKYYKNLTLALGTALRFDGQRKPWLPHYNLSAIRIILGKEGFEPWFLNQRHVGSRSLTNLKRFIRKLEERGYLTPTET